MMPRFAPLALLLLTACAGAERSNAGVNRPLSPADGAADYKEHPGGPHQPAIVPTTHPGHEPEGSVPAPIDCPPKCTDDGAWIGCGLKKPRGTDCKGCTPKCRGKGTPDEGWYDCSGVLIANAKCN